jgi:hypothetical protein
MAFSHCLNTHGSHHYACFHQKVIFDGLETHVICHFAYQKTLISLHAGYLICMFHLYHHPFNLHHMNIPHYVMAIVPCIMSHEHKTIEPT